MERDNQNKLNKKDWTQAFAERLGEGHLTPSPELWARVEDGLTEVRPATSLRKKLLAVVSGVAAVLLVILLLPREQQLIEPVIDMPVDMVESGSVTPVEIENEELVSCDVVVSEGVLVQNSGNEVIKDVVLIEEIVELEPATEVHDVKEETEQLELEYKYSDKYDKPNTEFVTEEKPEIVTKKNRKSRFTSISVSRSMYSATANSARYYDATPPLTASPSDKNYGSDAPQELIVRYKNASYLHKPPVSYSAAVNYRLTRHLSLETGLDYTALYSSVLLNGSSSTLSQELHYVGVPVNVSMKVLNTKHVALYCSAGATVEYCVGALLGSYKIDENKLAMSVGASVGGQLNLTKNSALYLEQGIRHYTTNTLLKTYRASNNYVLALRVGFRYMFD